MKNDYKKIAEHGGNAEALLKLFGAWPKNILDFSQNINPLGIPPGLKRNILKNFNEIMNYPKKKTGLILIRKILKRQFKERMLFFYAILIILPLFCSIIGH
ncbi:MAG: hypothetical protein HY810_00185 [Candidatus Omnitrophica bacterium]|nr:hypothetical protein [Candidatus Omnitrophota bacterium]